MFRSDFFTRAIATLLAAVMFFTGTTFMNKTPDFKTHHTPTVVHGMSDVEEAAEEELIVEYLRVFAKYYCRY